MMQFTEGKGNIFMDLDQRLLSKSLQSPRASPVASKSHKASPKKLSPIDPKEASMLAGTF